jgi:hypothetical protein
MGQGANDQELDKSNEKPDGVQKNIWAQAGWFL